MIQSFKPVAVITGASSGIGAELGRRYAQKGMRVALLARREGRLREVEQEIISTGGEAKVFVCDVGDRSEVLSAIREIISCWGRVDLAIANAGVANVHTADEFNLDLIESTYKVNLFGALNLASAVLPQFKLQGRGHLVGISSLASYRGLPNLLSYGGSKSALNRDFEAIRNWVYKYNIHVSIICPGFIKTEMTDGKPLSQPLSLTLERAVDKIERAIHKRKRFYAFPWPMAMAMRFLYVLPGWLFDPIARLYPHLPAPKVLEFPQVQSKHISEVN